eukprot:Hpha_TRINITY_DN11613_c0_g1::TRINITY_DN11613_c0_g1_i1::g.49007::m.49007
MQGAAVLLVVLGCAAVCVACNSAMDCSLNGDCVSGACSCAPHWEGDSCSRFKLRPVTFPQGYGMTPNHTTWGGGVVAVGGEYHMYVAAMTNGCGLGTWRTNSRVEHAVAKSPEGPYSFHDIAIDTWSHNPQPFILPDGRYCIFHIGTGEDGPHGGQNCSGNATSAPSPRSPLAGSRVHVSESPSGPWTPLDTTLPGCNNPAPWVMQNGTLFVVCNERNLIRADRVEGPYTKVATLPGAAKGVYEDAFLWTDSRGWHVLYHLYDNSEDPTQCVTSSVSAHLYSKDGFKWTAGGEQPYTTQVELTSGGTITVATRERPKLLFDSSGPTHLINGVCGATDCEPTPCVACKKQFWDYTLVQALG